MAGDGGGRGDGGGDEMRSPAASLAPLEVAVRGRSTALARRELVGVHGEAHGATRFAPVEARVAEDLIEAFALGFGLHGHRSGHDERAHSGVHLPTADDGRGGAEVFDA